MGNLSKFVPLRLSAELLARLDRMAREMGIKRSQIIQMALAQYLARHERGAGAEEDTGEES